MNRRLALCLMALAQPAGAFELVFPAACVLGETCYIQQYPDRDPGPEAADFTCGPLSYQDHDGTDIALPTRAAMATGVDVLAAAAGTVKGTRDGVADFTPASPGKECGNGVVIDHGTGWETQYCHLKRGSVTVRPGDKVEIGARLGQIGQSGLAEFPHLHLSVRQGGKDVDPFAPGAGACGAAGEDLWAMPLPYQPGGILALGLTDHVPEFEAIKAGLRSPDLPATAPALVVWAYLFGPRAGDALLLTLTGPSGAVLTERVMLEKTQALAFRAVGKRLLTAGWPPGRYEARVELLRRGEAIDSESMGLTLMP